MSDTARRIKLDIDIAASALLQKSDYFLLECLELAAKKKSWTQRVLEEHFSVSLPSKCMEYKGAGSSKKVFWILLPYDVKRKALKEVSQIPGLKAQKVLFL